MNLSENQRLMNTRGIEVNQFAQIYLIIEAKFGDDLSRNKTQNIEPE